MESQLRSRRVVHRDDRGDAVDVGPREGETNAEWVKRFNAMKICAPDLELERYLDQSGDEVPPRGHPCFEEHPDGLPYVPSPGVRQIPCAVHPDDVG